MSRIVTILIYLLAALSVAAGVPKIMQMPQELGFLGAIGFSPTVVVVLGVFQTIGGALLLLAKTRLVGASMVDFAFLASSAAIFVSGNIAFGLVSLLPVAAASIVLISVVLGRRTSIDQGDMG